MVWMLYQHPRRDHIYQTTRRIVPTGEEMTEETIVGAKELLGEHSTQVFINQILMALVIKNGGKLMVSLKEIDATGGYLMMMEVDPDTNMILLKAVQKQ